MKLVEAKTAAEAKKLYPGAAKIKKVTGGYMIFESISEYETWKNQK